MQIGRKFYEMPMKSAKSLKYCKNVFRLWDDDDRLECIIRRDEILNISSGPVVGPVLP